MTGWYKVTFYAKPAEGKEPILPSTPAEHLALAGALAEPFGFEIVDDVIFTAVQEQA